MSRNLAAGDVVVFTTLPATGRTYLVTETDPIRDDDTDPLVRVWPTDPDNTKGGQWISQSLLALATTCPQHCPGCGINLRAEGYPVGHQNDDGDQCEWSWERQAAILADLHLAELAELDQAEPVTDETRGWVSGKFIPGPDWLTVSGSAHQLVTLYPTVEEAAEHARAGDDNIVALVDHPGQVDPTWFKVVDGQWERLCLYRRVGCGASHEDHPKADPTMRARCAVHSPNLGGGTAIQHYDRTHDRYVCWHCAMDVFHSHAATRRLPH